MKIQRGAASCRTPVGYNERKVASGEAMVVGVSNMEGDSLATVLRTFDAYENNPAISARTRSLSFHMSINPGPGERLDDSRAMALARDIMEGLGYGSQPFIVYRHTDTGREHFHVVSVKVDSTGRVISDSNQRRRLQAILRDLGPRYGFVVGRGQGRTQGQSSGVSLRRFDPEAGNRTEQISDITRRCLSYSFSTREQFEMLLRRCGVRIVSSNTPSGERMQLQGLDRSGAPTGRPVKASTLGINLRYALEERLREGPGELRCRRREKDRVRGIALSCLGYSSSARHFGRMLERKGITVVFSRSEDGRIFGATFMDHGSRSVFKCSELGEGISAGLFRDAEERGQWSVKEGQERESAVAEETQKESIPHTGAPDAKSMERDIRKKRKRKKGLSI